VKRNDAQENRIMNTINKLPRCDIFEGKDEVWISFDLPNVKKDDVKIEIENDQLRVDARAGKFLDDDDGEVVFARAFRLPPGVNTSKVNAEMKDGVLTLKLPKPDELKPRRIQIN
jgi:HSP20 family molecular chaperone IbpA